MIFSRIYQFAPSADGAGIAVNAAQADTNQDDVHESLFDSLRASFHGNTRRQHGQFDDTTPPLLLTALLDYRNDAIDAPQVGDRIAEAFRTALQDNGLSRPLYLWCIVEQGGETKTVYLFLLQHEESYRLTPQHTAVLEDAIRLDRLHYAARLNLAEWRAGSETFATFLAPRNQQGITLAWKGLLGFRENVAHVEKTEALLSAVDRYAESLPEEKEQGYRARVAEYCLEQDRIGAPVELKELSRHVDEEEPAALLDFIAQRIEEAQAPLYADRRQLKRYTRLFGRDNDLSIGFSTQMLGNHIIYDEEAGTLTIRSIPKSLRSQLARHTRKAE